MVERGLGGDRLRMLARVGAVRRAVVHAARALATLRHVPWPRVRVAFRVGFRVRARIRARGRDRIRVRARAISSRAISLT